MNDLPSKLDEATRLIDQGKHLLDQQRASEAEALFRQAAATYPLPTAYNNWALCRYQAKDPDGVLKVLDPLLRDPALAPYSRALGSLALGELGRTAEAQALLSQAIADFDRGQTDPDVRPHSFDSAWIEYTALIKRAAGFLGNHKLVLDLHKRWPGQNLAAGAYVAGIAAFNLGRYYQAARYWRRVTDREWRNLLTAYAAVADLVAGGIVPPFALEYEAAEGHHRGPVSEADVAALTALGSTRMLLIATAFEPGAEGAAETVSGLVYYGEDWGVALGLRLLSAYAVSNEVKLAAAQGLIERGVYAPGSAIPAVINGRPTTLEVQTIGFNSGTPEVQAQYEEALRLRDSGKKDKAYKLLQKMAADKDVFPPALLALANLMRERGELDAAQSHLETLERIAPNEPSILYNLAGLWLQKGKKKRARQYFDRLRAMSLPPDVAAAMGPLEDALAPAGSRRS